MVMDSQTVISYVLGAISGLALAVLKTVPKIVEDIWTDHREARKAIKLDKNNLVSQLLYDLPKGKAQDFYYTTVKKSDGEHIVARMSKYDKKMAQQIDAYLDLWRHYATSKRLIDDNHEIVLMDEYDEPVSKGPLYVEGLLDRLCKEYGSIIDLLNKWKV